MSEFNYFKEKKRMLDSIGRTNGACVGVPRGMRVLIAPALEFASGNCNALELEHPEIATGTMREWAKAHPARTRKDILLEKLPHAMLASDGRPLVCDDCTNICAECWDTEVE